MKTAHPEFWTAFFTGVLAGATLYALVYANRQIAAVHEEGQIQHLLQLQQQYEQEPLVTYRRRLAESRLKGEQEPDDLYKLLDFFETIGRLIDRDYLNESDVWDNFGYPVLIVNADAGNLISSYRQGDRAAYVGFTSLVERLTRIESKHHGALEHPSKLDVTTFYQEELSVGAGAPITQRGHGSRKR